MKTATSTLPKYSFIDTAPLAARYELLCASMMMFIEAGQMARVLRLTHKVRRLVRAFTQLDRHNRLLRLKLDMLSNAAWRERVLRELGGLRKLKLWEAARARIEARRNSPPRPKPVSISEQTPAWLLTPSRMAESERLKAHARLCGRATAHPLILRDRVKMNFDGLFRLAPLPRGERAKRRLKIYTQNTIVDYDWNNIPFAKETGFGPASVWPAEFYAAMATDDQIVESSILFSSPPCVSLQTRERGPRKNRGQQLGPPIHEDDRKKGRDDKRESLLLHPKYILSPKVHRDLFGSLTR